MRDDLRHMLESIAAIRSLEGNLLNLLAVAMREAEGDDGPMASAPGTRKPGDVPRPLPQLGEVERKIVRSILGSDAARDEPAAPNRMAGQGRTVPNRRLTDADFEMFRAQPFGLSRREVDVLRLVFAGLSNKEIARDLGISPRTVETHRSRIMQKLQAESAPHLVRVVMERIAERGE